MSKDIRNEIVERLEEYCNKNDLRCCWTLERRSEGSLVINIKPKNIDIPDRWSYTQRINHAEMETCSIDDIVGRVIEVISKF